LRIPGPEQPAPEEHLDQAFAAFGLVLAPDTQLDLEEDFFLWPENVAAFNLWLEVQTQWHTDNGVRTGLNYPGVDICIRYMAAPKKEKPWYFAAIKAMERAALDEWSRQQ
jgi:hypothetical protein